MMTLHFRERVMVATVLLAAALSVQAAESTPPAVFRNLEAGKKQTVIVYGTSLTHGGAWAVATKEWFEAQYPGLVTFINSGGPGQNSDWGVQSLKSKVLAHHPDLVFIEFSYNDAHEKFNMAVEKGASNLDTIVKEIHEQSPETTVVLQVMNANWDTPKGSRSMSSRPQLEAFNNNYRAYAREHDLPLLDHFINWQKLKEADVEKFHQYVPDGTHPSKEGSLAITWPTIKEWLEKSREAAKHTKPAP